MKSSAIDAQQNSRECLPSPWMLLFGAMGLNLVCTHMAVVLGRVLTRLMKGFVYSPQPPEYLQLFLRYHNWTPFLPSALIVVLFVLLRVNRSPKRIRKCTLITNLATIGLLGGLYAAIRLLDNF